MIEISISDIFKDFKCILIVIIIHEELRMLYQRSQGTARAAGIFGQKGKECSRRAVIPLAVSGSLLSLALMLK